MKPYLEIEKYSEAYNLLMEFKNKCVNTKGYPNYVEGTTPDELLVMALKYVSGGASDEVERMSNEIDDLFDKTSDLEDRIDELEDLLRKNNIDF